MLLEHYHTRPADFRGETVPDVAQRQPCGDRDLASAAAGTAHPGTAPRPLCPLDNGRRAPNPRDADPIGSDDIHRLVAGRPLILGGVTLDHPDGLGLDGHSDADVLVHAVMDALLGALSLGDIGKYFPPTDPQWKGADSLQLLEQVVALVSQRGWQVVNVDAVVIAERPKLKPHIEAMRGNIASRIGLAADNVGVKATTNERLGPEGREEGISCQAVVLLGQP